MLECISRKELERLRKKYPKGTRVRLVKMDDLQAPAIGTLRTIQGIDDMGNIEFNL